MATLGLVLGILESQPWGVRRRFVIRRIGSRAMIRSGAMQVGEVEEGLIEVAYEHPLHEITRERLAPEDAARLILAVIQRDELDHVDASDL